MIGRNFFDKCELQIKMVNELNKTRQKRKLNMTDKNFLNPSEDMSITHRNFLNAYDSIDEDFSKAYDKQVKIIAEEYEKQAKRLSKLIRNNLIFSLVIAAIGVVNIVVLFHNLH